MTETTNKPVYPAKTATLYYDGTCQMCSGGTRRLEKPLATVGIHLCPFREGATQPEAVLDLRGAGTLHGAEAMLYLAEQWWITRPIARLLGSPLLMPATDRVYRWVARNRHRFNTRNCALYPEKKSSGWLILANLVAAALAIGTLFDLAGWLWMWLLAIAMWLGFKVMCYRHHGGLAEVHPAFFLWPGMDAADFTYDRRATPHHTTRLGAATGFIIAGIACLGLLTITDQPYARGRLAIIAMLCLLHFGSFDFMARFWQRLGIPAQPIMRQPWLARGLGDFWGNRWNRGYSDWARVFLFQPLTARWGRTIGMYGGFLASGLAHELAITVPCRAGYGLPTIYFLLQAVGIHIEKRLRLRRRHWLSRLWLAAVVLIPAPFLLFFPAFLKCVFYPMTSLLPTF